MVSVVTLTATSQQSASDFDPSSSFIGMAQPGITNKKSPAHHEGTPGLISRNRDRRTTDKSAISRLLDRLRMC